MKGPETKKIIKKEIKDFLHVLLNDMNDVYIDKNKIDIFINHIIDSIDSIDCDLANRGECMNSIMGGKPPILLLNFILIIIIFGIVYLIYSITVSLYNSVKYFYKYRQRS